MARRKAFEVDPDTSLARRVGLAFVAGVVLTGWLLACSLLWFAGKVFHFAPIQGEE